MFKGPVELAAVGVSIALFNQASRIAIFPLVSVTTSFVAEEDTIGTVSPEAKDSDYLETGSSTNGEMKQLIPESGMLHIFFLMYFVCSVYRLTECDCIKFVNASYLIVLFFFNVISQMPLRMHTTQNPLLQALK